MKRVFRFKKGQMWDGDEAIIDFLMDYLLDDEYHIRRNAKITVIAEEED